jgi:hypothetical protein
VSRGQKAFLGAVPVVVVVVDVGVGVGVDVAVVGRQRSSRAALQMGRL